MTWPLHRRSSAVALALAFMLSAGRSSVAAPAPGRVLPFDLRTETLANGLRLVMVPRATPGIVAYYSLVRVGSRDEVEAGVTGFAHFFEHMMFRGTARWPADKVQEFLLQAGADQNGFTTDDFTCYTFLGSSAALETLVDYEADRFQRLDYSEADFKTEAGAVLGEYNKSSSGTYLPLQEKLRKKVFTQHTYGHTTLGYLKDIKKMPEQYAYSREFFRRFYTPDNVTLIVVGDFEPARLSALVRDKYGAWKGKRAATAAKAEPQQQAEVRAEVPFASRTSPLLSSSWRTPATRYGSAETAAYNVLFQLLFGEVSPLHDELVLKTQSVIEFDEWSWNHRDPFVFQVVATVREASRLDEVVRAVDRAVSDLAAQKLDPKLLEDVKSHVRYELLLGLETPSAIAERLAFAIAPTGELDGLEKLLASIQRLTVKDVAAFASKYLVKRNRAVVTLVSTEESK
jgi:zinc protease